MNRRCGHLQPSVVTKRALADSCYTRRRVYVSLTAFLRVEQDTHNSLKYDCSRSDGEVIHSCLSLCSCGVGQAGLSLAWRSGSLICKLRPRQSRPTATAWGLLHAGPHTAHALARSKRGAGPGRRAVHFANASPCGRPGARDSGTAITGPNCGLTHRASCPTKPYRARITVKQPVCCGANIGELGRLAQ